MCLIPFQYVVDQNYCSNLQVISCDFLNQFCIHICIQSNYRINKMKRPLSCQFILKQSQARPKTAETYSFKKIAALLEKKYRSFQSRGNHSSSSKDIQEDRKKRYYVERLKPKNTNQRQLQYGTFFKVKNFDGLLRFQGINKQTNINVNANFSKEKSNNPNTFQKVDFEQLNFGQGKRSSTATQGKIRNESQKFQGTTELIKRLLNLRQGSACKGSSIFLTKKPESICFDENSKFIPYTYQSQQQKIVDNQAKLYERVSKIIERKGQRQRESLQIFSKPEKLNEKIQIQIKVSAKKFLNGKLQKRGKFGNFSSKSIKEDKTDKTDKENVHNIPQSSNNFNGNQKKPQSKGKSCKQFIIDEWEQTDEFRNPSESFTSLFQVEF